MINYITVSRKLAFVWRENLQTLNVNHSLPVSDLKNLHNAFKHIPMNILGSATLPTAPSFVPISPLCIKESPMWAVGSKTQMTNLLCYNRPEKSPGSTFQFRGGSEDQERRVTWGGRGQGLGPFPWLRVPYPVPVILTPALFLFLLVCCLPRQAISHRFHLMAHKLITKILQHNKKRIFCRSAKK